MTTRRILTASRPYAAVFAVALILRIAYLFDARTSYPLFSTFIADAGEYNRWALRIAGGAWLSPAAFYQDPLYPYFLGILYRLFGYAPFLVRCLQACLGAAACVLVFEAGRRLFGRREGWAAGFLSAFYGIFIFYEGTLLKDSLSVFLASALTLSLVCLHERPTVPWAGMTGLLIGLLGLIRANVFLVAPLLFVAIVLMLSHRTRTMPFRTAAAFAAGVLLPVIPPLAHNYVVARDLVITTSQAGLNFYSGNNPAADGTYRPPAPLRGTPMYERNDAHRLASEEAGRPLAASEMSDFWKRKAFNYIRSEPLDWLALMGRKAALFLDGHEIPDIEDFYVARRYVPALRWAFVGWGLVLALAAVGAFLRRREARKLFLLYLFAAAYSLSVVLFFVMARYRFPIIPLLLTLAGAAIIGIYDAARRKRYRVAAGALASAATLWFIVDFPNREREAASLSMSITNIASARVQDGDADGAFRFVSDALSLNPGNSFAYHVLGNLYSKFADWDQAIRAYQEALNRDPSDVESLFKLGYAYSNRGDSKKAAEAWRRLLDIYPRHDMAPEIRKALGISRSEG